MQEKNIDNEELVKKAIDIRGKAYVMVKDRISYFKDNYPEGSIITELLSAPDAKTVVVKATVKPWKEGEQIYTGHSQAEVGKGMMGGVALENAETSAVGRALAMMGIGIIDSIASVDEMKKAGAYPEPLQEEEII